MTPDEERVRHMLDLSRDLRHTDTALTATREVLDDLADQVIRLRGRDLPPTLGDRLEAAAERISQLIRRRDVLLRQLEQLAPTVPVRVYSQTVPSPTPPEGNQP